MRRCAHTYPGPTVTLQCGCSAMTGSRLCFAHDPETLARRLAAVQSGKRTRERKRATAEATR